MRKQLQERVRLYFAHNDHRNFLHNTLLLLQNDMLSVSARINSLQMSFNQMVFEVTEFQRCFLEIRGLLDYLEVYEPRISGRHPAATAVAKCVGAITSIPNVVQGFFNAGLPVWFIRPLQPGPFPHNVLNVVSCFESANFVCVDHADPPFPVIYDGPLNKLDKHNALHRFSRQSLVLKDPFQYHPSSAIKASTSTASTSTGSATRRPHCKYILFFATFF